MFADLLKHKVKAVVDAGGEVEIAFLGEKALRSFVSYVPNEWGCTHELEITVTASPKFGSGHNMYRIECSGQHWKGKVRSSLPKVSPTST